jgi:hypothetical protein
MSDQIVFGGRPMSRRRLAHVTALQLAQELQRSAPGILAMILAHGKYEWRKKGKSYADAGISFTADDLDYIFEILKIRGKELNLRPVTNG